MGQAQQKGANRALGRIGIPRRRRRHGTPRVEDKLRRSATDEFDARISRYCDLVVVGLDHFDVHQLRKLVEVVIALVEQRCGGAVNGAHGGKLMVDLGEMRHRVIGPRCGIREAELGIAAQPLDAGGHAVELLRKHLGRSEHGIARRSIVRAGRERLHGRHDVHLGIHHAAQPTQ